MHYKVTNVRSRRKFLVGLGAGAGAFFVACTAERPERMAGAATARVVLTDLIQSVRSSVVVIGGSVSGAPGQTKISIGGTGFVVSRSGDILTAYHIFRDMPDPEKQNMVALVLTDAVTYTAFPIKIERTDESHDFALFRFQRPPAPLPAALRLGDSDNVKDGEEMMFIGFPHLAKFVELNLGITLATTHCVVSSAKKAQADRTITTLFLLDVHNNSGTSGAPLISLQTGHVVGMMAGNFGTPAKQLPGVREIWTLSYAQPINFAKPFVKE